MRVGQWSTVRVVVLNTHVGWGIRHGVWAWIKMRLMRWPHIVLINEVRDRDLKDVRLAFGPSWTIVGEDSKTSGTNYVMLRGKRWVVETIGDQDIRMNSEYGRSVRGCRVWDRKTKRHFTISSAHPNPLGDGLWGANAGARQKHALQVAATVGWHELVAKPDDVEMSGGDWNEAMDIARWSKYPEPIFKISAISQWDMRGLKPASIVARRKSGPVRLMELFVRTKARSVAVTKRKSVDTNIRGMDHEVVAVWLRIKKGDKR